MLSDANIRRKSCRSGVTAVGGLTNGIMRSNGANYLLWLTLFLFLKNILLL